MRLIQVRAFLLLAFVVAVPSSYAQRQPLTAAAQDHPGDLPAPLSPHAAALGDRALFAGKETTVLAGQFVDETGKTATVRLTLQPPELLRLEGLTAGGPPLIFDRGTRNYQRTRNEEALLETFTEDTAEGMLAAIREGAAIQLVARRVGPDPSKRQAAASPPHDIYEISEPVHSGAADVERLKRYFFDSETGLLDSTQYTDETVSPPIEVETRFANWRLVDGSAYPGRIERLENGRTVFSLTVDSVAASPGGNPSTSR